VWVIVVIAVVVAIAAYLAGRPAWLERLREQRAAGRSEASDLDRWIAPKFDGLRIAGIALAVVILYFTGIGVVAVLVVGGLLALYLWALSAARNRAAAPSPDDADAPVTVPAGPDPGAP
jgi:hypothetical protein